MGVLSGCESTMKNTNTIDTGKRISFYTNIHKYMTGLGCKVTVEDVKQSIMTHYYNSKAIPRELFRKEETLESFYEALKKELMGAEEILTDINGCWDPTVSVIKWKLPNGHTVVIENKTKKKKRINNELLGGSFTYIYDEYGPSKRGAHLPANIIHSLDGYVVHELVTECSKQGIKVLPIHDCFYASPVHMNTVRNTYNKLLADLHESNALESILQDITGDTTLEYLQFRDDLGNFIRKSNYALS